MNFDIKNNELILNAELLGGTAPTITGVTLASDNTTMTVTFSEAVYNTNSGSGSLEVSDFVFVLSGGTATLLSTTPSSISINGNEYTLGISLSGTPNGSETLTVNPVSSSIYDVVGNVASTSQSNNSISLNDKLAPSMTISSSTVNSGDTSNDSTISLTFTSSESTTNFIEDDITISGGSLSSFSGSGTTYTATLTPSGDATYTISVAQNKFTDSGGNNNSASNTFTWTYDSTAPLITSITPSWGSHLNATKDNSSGTVTVVTSGVEDGQTLTIRLNGSDYTGSISNNIVIITISASNLQNLSEGTNTITANVSDAAGNAATETSTTFIYDKTTLTVDTFTLSDTALKIGDTATVTIVFSEAVSNFSSENDISVVNGSLTTMTSNDNITWTGTFTPTSDIDDTTNVLTLSSTYTDTAGNYGPSATTSNFTIDTKSPTVISFILSDSALKIGDTATVKLIFSESVSGFSSDDDVTVQNGSLSTMTTSDNIIWTGTFTPTSSITDSSNILSLSTAYTDTAGNAGPSATTSNYEIDTTAPTVNSFTMSDSALKIGDTATVTLIFSEVVSNFSNDDIIVQNGTLSTMTTSDNITWTGTFTPTSNIEDTTNILTLGTFYTDTAGNTGPSATTSNFEIDTSAPTITSITSSWGSYLNATDDNSNGTISIITSGVEDGQTFTLTLDGNNYTGSISNNSVTITITSSILQDLTNGSSYTIAGNISDAAGNSAIEVTTNFIVDRTAPTAAISYSPSGPYKLNDSVTITATFSEDMVTSPITKIIITGSGIDSVSATDMTKVSTTSYTYTYSVPSGDGTGTISLSTGTDLAGNLITTTPTNGASFTVDNTQPTAAITYSSSSPYRENEVITITATFNEIMIDSPVPLITISGSGTLVGVTDQTMTKSSTTVYTFNYTVQSGDGTGTITLSTGTDLASNTVVATPTSGSTFVVDNTSPTIFSIAPSWGSFLNAVDDDTDGTITVKTIGVEDNEILTVTLDSQNYTGSITDNTVIITISSNILQNLTEDNDYIIVANVNDEAGNSAPTPSYAWDFRIDSSTGPIDSISGLQSTYENGLTSSVTMGAYFAGVSSFINLQDFELGGTCSFEAYVRYDDVGEGARVFDFHENVNEDNIILHRLDSDSDLRFILWYTTGTSGATGIADGGTITNGQFTHLVATVTSAGVMKLYQDGILVSTLSSGVTAPTVMTRNNHYLGKSHWSGDPMLKGYMKYFRVWQGHELTQAQVSHLYSYRNFASQGSITFKVDRIAPIISNISLNWGSTLTDISNKSITLTTSGVEDGQIATVTINNINYANTISSNSTTINILSTDLDNLVNGTTYTVFANVSDEAGNPANQVTETFLASITANYPTLTIHRLISS
jgi:hypothetical protein